MFIIVLMKKNLFYIIITLLVYTSLITGCGKKSPPKPVVGGVYPQTYPKD